MSTKRYCELVLKFTIEVADDVPQEYIENCFEQYLPEFVTKAQNYAASTFNVFDFDNKLVPNGHEIR